MNITSSKVNLELTSDYEILWRKSPRHPQGNNARSLLLQNRLSCLCCRRLSSFQFEIRIHPCCTQKKWKAFLSRSLNFVRTDLNLFVLMSGFFTIVVSTRRDPLSSDLDWLGQGDDRENCGSIDSVDEWWRGDECSSSRDEDSIYRMSQNVSMAMCTCVWITNHALRQYCYVYRLITWRCFWRFW